MSARRLPPRGIAAVVLVAALVCSLLLFLGLAHGLHSASSDGHEGMTDELGGICLVLFIVLLPAALAAAVRTQARPALLGAFWAAIAGASPVSHVPASARASPCWLQRFRR